MSNQGSTQSMKMSLSNWMRDLPSQLKDIPLIYLAIPGSHDSMTYSITRSSGLAPDAEPILKNLYPLFRGTILRWTITQAIDALQQLLIGIRLQSNIFWSLPVTMVPAAVLKYREHKQNKSWYFDLRLATKNGTEDFFFTHGLYASEITQPLTQIKDYLDTHPDEVVILDLQHFYGFTPDDHRRLMRMILNMFGSRLVPRPFNLQGVTLNSLNRQRQQVVIVYRNEAVFSSGEFWQGQMLPSPWPKQDKVEGLLRFLEHIKRHPSTGFVHQAVLTPTPTFIVLRWASNLREKCAVPVKKNVLPTLAQFSPGPPIGFDTPSRAPVNVVIADFVDLEDAVFPRTIIELNMKLLTQNEGVESVAHGGGPLHTGSYPWPGVS